MSQKFQKALIIFVWLAFLCQGIGKAEEAPHPNNRILLKIRPVASPKERQKALTLLATLFESEIVKIKTGTRVDDLSRSRCGRIDADWISALYKENPNLPKNDVLIASELKLPPCPFWKSTKTVRLTEGESVTDQLLTHMGSLGRKTLGNVAFANDRTVGSLDHVKAGDELTLPYVTAFSGYTLRDEYRNEPERAAALERQIPGFIASTPSSKLNLIVAASDSDCVAPSTPEAWPFPAKDLVSVLRYNDAHRRHSPLTAVIAIADTGIDPNESRLFFRTNAHEIPDNNIDDDEDGYIDDVIGANMDTTVAGYPALDSSYRYKEHATHVSGLALGGLLDNSLDQLIQGRIQVQELNMVRKDVQQIGSGPPSVSFSMPNEFLLNALSYASTEDPPAQIINLSVEGEDKTGLESALGSSYALVVVAAGNDGQDLDEKEVYPAAAASRARLLTVAAYDGSNGLAHFSNWGRQSVDIAAPGCQIDSILPGNQRGKLSGTSQAAPLVSFTAALLYSEGLTIPQIKNRILLTGDFDHARLGICSGVNGRCIASEGRLDIVRALNIYQDLIVVQHQDGTRVPLSGRVSGCVPLDGRCYDPHSELKRFLHDPLSGDGTVWLKSQDNRLSSRASQITPDGTIQFQVPGSATVQPIPINSVVDFVSAVY